MTVRAELGRAEARYQRIQSIIQTHETEALVTEAIGNAIIEQLRAKYLDASKREAELEAKVGEDHNSVINLRSEIAQYKKQMFAELSRLAEAHRSEVDIERAKEKSIADTLARLIEVSAKENRAQVTLRELESDAQAYSNLYQSYMQRYQEALQQQSFPILEARVITSASAPERPSSPKKLFLAGVFALFGGGVGAAIGVLREFREKGFNREEQVRDELGVECLGLLPVIKNREVDQGSLSLSGSKIYGAIWPSRRSIKSRTRGTGTAEGQSADSLLLSYSFDRPNSAFTETLLSVKLAADIKLSGCPSKVIGITSTLPGEGKSTVSKNFASLLACHKSKTLLIDADLRGPGITQRLAPRAEAGLIDAVIGKQPLESLLLTVDGSGLSFLPSVRSTKVPHTSELLASRGMLSVLEQVERQFEYVIIDLPPFGPVVDVRAIAPQLQAFVYVAKWRSTSRSLVRDILENYRDIRHKCLGIVLNKVDFDRIENFEGHGSRYYYMKHYMSSYYTE